MNFDHAVAAALFAVDPSGLGGVALRASPGPARDDWLALLRSLLPASAPVRRVPLNINDAALLGGLDLGATLQAGRPVAQQGVLALADGGVAVLAMAERLSVGAAARLAAVLDTQEVVLERDGLALRRPARLGMLALDEGASDDERTPAALLDRLAFHLDERAVSGASEDSHDHATWQASEIAAARACLPLVKASDEVLQALCSTALALGVSSMRAPWLALRVARAAAALAGMDEVIDEHAALAARLVLGPRATQLPAAAQSEADRETDSTGDDETPPEPPPPPEPPESPPDPGPPTEPEPPDESGEPGDSDEDSQITDADIKAAQELAASVLAAAQAAIPAGLLAALKVGEAARSRSQVAGRAGAVLKSRARGRPIGARRGEPRAAARLNVIETLRAAAPWQRLRAQQALLVPGATAAPRRIHVRREDFHVTRFKQVGQTTTMFVVDASGSSALNRLAEAKGAVELLLADCYVRRDRVSVLAFRGSSAEMLLPPTRSLARAKRSLAALAGGGGTPLAAGLDAARELADLISRRGETPIVVLLTDGRANVARDGSPGRVRANEDALVAARQIRLAGLTALLLDTSPQPQPVAQLLAEAMNAAYVPLPYAGSQLLSQAVRLATTRGNPAR